jgi:predicted acylesterase/phospholipase RssA
MGSHSILKRLAGKRTALALSAGYFGFYHQAGVLKALIDANVRPVRISGNSAGALVAGMYAAGLEPTDIRDRLLALKRKDFWDMGRPLDARGIGLLDGYRFQKELARSLPVSTFEGCRIPLTVGAYDLDVGRIKYLSSGPLVPAVYASCAIPYLFKPVKIDGRRLWDGGFAEKTPLAPFVELSDIDAVLISYLPPRKREARKRTGILSFLPHFASLFADIPADERKERDRIAAELLEKSGKEVIVLAPPRLAVGPFCLEKARQSFEQGEEGAAALLNAKSEAPGSATAK